MIWLKLLIVFHALGEFQSQNQQTLNSLLPVMIVTSIWIVVCLTLEIS